MNLTAWGLSVVLVALTTESVPESTQVTRSDVEARLRSAEPTLHAGGSPGSGANVPALLMDVGGDTAVESLVRARAVSALGEFPSKATSEFLATLITKARVSDSPEDRILLRRALLALGQHGGEPAARRIEPLLDHEDVDVRRDAATALALTRDWAAVRALKIRLRRETDGALQLHIQRQIVLLQEALDPVAHPTTTKGPSALAPKRPQYQPSGLARVEVSGSTAPPPVQKGGAAGSKQQKNQGPSIRVQSKRSPF